MGKAPSFRAADQASAEFSGQQPSVQAQEGGVTTDRRDGGLAVGQPLEVPVLEGLDMGDRSTEPVVDGEQVEPTLQPGVAQQLPDLLGGGARLLLVLAPTRCSAPWPDHLSSPVDVCWDNSIG